MGGFQTKEKKSKAPSITEKLHVEEMRRIIRHQHEKINEIMCMRDSESEAYEKEMMGFVVKEVEWKRERKKLRAEVKRLRQKLQEREDEKLGINNCNNNYLVDQMREERAWQDEAVEKWKKLYLDIKVELDDLITRTNQGQGILWRVDEEEKTDDHEIQREVKAKEEQIEILQSRLASMEQQESRREGEMDILRQSLRIMTHSIKSRHKSTKGSSKRL
ncbi:hypothetical protein LguiA_001336 [Lonicera macranthoides]